MSGATKTFPSNPVFDRLGWSVEEVLKTVQEVAERLWGMSTKDFPKHPRPSRPRTRIPVPVREEMRALAGIDVASPSEETIRALEVQKASQWAVLLQGSVSSKEAAELLGVSEGRIRQLAAEKALYGFKWKRGWRFPRFQFVDGHLLPGLAEVVQALPDNVSPVSFCSWMTQPSGNLYVEEEHRGLSPVEWLRRRFPVSRVIALAKHLDQGI